MNSNNTTTSQKIIKFCANKHCQMSAIICALWVYKESKYNRYIIYICISLCQFDKALTCQIEPSIYLLTNYTIQLLLSPSHFISIYIYLHLHSLVQNDMYMIQTTKYHYIKIINMLGFSVSIK